jgi:Ca2+-binding RTX toxin-like protein
MRRLGFVIVIAIVASLGAAASAGAAIVGTVSYTDPTGGTTATRGGTITVDRSAETTGDFLSFYFNTEGASFTQGPLSCTSGDAPPEASACDNVSVDGTDGVTVNAPCEIQFQTIFCPDANSFVVNGGSGNDNIAFNSPLEYNTATVHGNGGNDTITGTDATLTTFPDVDVFYGDAGNDTLSGSNGNDQLHGGDGNDNMDGRGGNDSLYGEGGDDHLYGGDGNDYEDGGDGNDNFGIDLIGLANDGPDAGSDTFVGGAGIDVMSYDPIEASSTPVNVTLDGVANDGQPGENDNVGSDIEEIDGGPGNDILTAGAIGVTLNGEGGNDTLNGGPGNDTLIGSAGDDTISGGLGSDSIYGDGTSCTLGLFGSCLTGNDTINAVDGVQDQISCGPGADIVNADALDVVATDPINGCETVNRTGASPQNPNPNPNNPQTTNNGSTTFTVSSVSGGAAGFVKNGDTVTVSCPAACTITIDAELSASAAKKAHLAKSSKPVIIATGHGSLSKAGKVKIKLKPTSKAKSRLKHNKHPITATIKVTTKIAGKSHVTTKTAKL